MQNASPPCHDLNSHHLSDAVMCGVSPDAHKSQAANVDNKVHAINTQGCWLTSSPVNQGGDTRQSATYFSFRPGGRASQLQVT